MRCSMAQPFYDIAPELGFFRLHDESRQAHPASVGDVGPSALDFAYSSGDGEAVSN